VRAPATPHEPGVYDSGRVGYLSCAQGSYIPCSGQGIHRGVHNVLRARIRCVITLFPPLTGAVLRPKAADGVPDLLSGGGYIDVAV
jgi:hypothetical protein